MSEIIPKTGQIWKFKDNMGGIYLYKLLNKPFSSFNINKVAEIKQGIGATQMSVLYNGGVRYKDEWVFIKDPSNKCERCKING